MPLHVKSNDVPEKRAVRTGGAGQGSMISRPGLWQRMQPDDCPGRAQLHDSSHSRVQSNFIREGGI